jgi:anti-anti-sigma factor
MSEFPTTYANRTAIVTVPRRVSAENAPELLTLAEGLLAQDCQVIILDLGTTEAMDSTALGVVVRIYKSLRSRQGSLLLAEVQRPIDRLLAITRLNSIFARFGSVAAASAHPRRAA